MNRLTEKGEKREKAVPDIGVRFNVCVNHTKYVLCICVWGVLKEGKRKRKPS